MSGDLYYLLPEEVEYEVEQALLVNLNGRFELKFDNVGSFQYMFDFDPKTEDSVEFDGPIYHTTSNGENIELTLESSQTSSGERVVEIKPSGNDHIRVSSKSEYR